MIIKEKTITEFIQHATGFTISKSDLINGKVVVNNIEITSIEDWNKVTKSLIELQQENNQLKEQLKTKHDGFMASIEQNCEYATILIELRSWLEEHYDYSDCIKIKAVLDKLNELEGGKNE